MKYRLGLVLAIILGLLIALFPLYGKALTDYIWTYETTPSRKGKQYGKPSSFLRVLRLAGREYRIGGSYEGYTSH
ncbi:MAG: hypothetical protein DRJ38_04595 [Thermoprotei archaeon]|nr:MAG: hypothetical protein DRJ38_04595 [Thermoprotei archaeon]